MRTPAAGPQGKGGSPEVACLLQLEVFVGVILATSLCQGCYAGFKLRKHLDREADSGPDLPKSLLARHLAVTGDQQTARNELQP